MLSCLHWFHIMYTSWQVAISLFCPVSSRSNSNTFIISHLPTFFQVTAVMSVSLRKFQSVFQFHLNNFIYSFVPVSLITIFFCILRQWCGLNVCKILLRSDQSFLTHKQLETNGYILSTVATAALVLKHQSISSYSADNVFIVLDHIHTKMCHLLWKTLENQITFSKKIYLVV